MKRRKHQRVCTCSAYPFPHREGGGRCGEARGHWHRVDVDHDVFEYEEDPRVMRADWNED